MTETRTPPPPAPVPHPRQKSSLLQAWPRIIVAVLIAVLVTAIEHGLKIETYSLTPVPFTIVGVALGIFLGFRNNTAYTRFWEARSLWGRLINVSRSLARQISLLVTLPTGDETPLGHEARSPQRARLQAFQRDAVLLIAAYAHSLRHHLRATDPQPDLARILPPADCDRLAGIDNVPLAMIQMLDARLQQARRMGWIADVDALTIQTSLTEVDTIQGGCEKINNTPVPLTYTHLSHHIVAAFCYCLPFGIVDTTKWLTPFVVLLVAYAFFGLDALGEEVTDPFGTDPHDVALELLSETIEKKYEADTRRACPFRLGSVILPGADAQMKAGQRRNTPR